MIGGKFASSTRLGCGFSKAEQKTIGATMTEFEEAMMVRSATQGNETAQKWLDELYRRTNGRDGLPYPQAKEKRVSEHE